MVAVAHGLLSTTTTHRLPKPILTATHKSLGIVDVSSSSQRSTSSSVVRTAREVLLDLGTAHPGACFQRSRALPGKVSALAIKPVWKGELMVPGFLIQYAWPLYTHLPSGPPACGYGTGSIIENSGGTTTSRSFLWCAMPSMLFCSIYDSDLRVSQFGSRNLRRRSDNNTAKKI